MLSAIARRNGLSSKVSDAVATTLDIPAIAALLANPSAKIRAQTLEKLVEAGTLTSVPLKDFVAAVSVGIVDGEILLDLSYEEDSRADVDMNFVMTAGYKLVEVQATAERQVFDEQQLGKMIALARAGVQQLIAKQQAILGVLTLRQ